MSNSLTDSQRRKRTQLWYGQRRRRRARLKHIGLAGNRFVVWGGQQPHYLSFKAGQPQCDCEAFVSGKTSRCSHLEKLRMFLDGECALEVPPTHL